MAVGKLISELTKAYGKPVIYSASDVPAVMKIPSGNPAFDYVSGGGFPVNRITELIGAEASTKSLHTYLALIAFQKTDWSEVITPGAIRSIEWRRVSASVKAAAKKPKKGEKAAVEDAPSEASAITFTEVGKVTAVRGVRDPVVKRVALIDTEGTFDPAWAARWGVDLEGLLHVVPETLAQGVDIADALLRDPEISLVVIDSMSAVGAAAEVDNSMEDEQMALNARFWNKAVRKFQAALNANPSKHVSLIMVNTLTNKVGFVLGNPETPKNGTGIKYAKSLSIQFRGGKIHETDGEQEGRMFHLKNLKSKVGQPFREFSFFYSLSDTGSMKANTIDITGAIVELAVYFKLVERSGAWYSYGDFKQSGLEKFKAALQANPSVIEELKKKVYARF